MGVEYIVVAVPRSAAQGAPSPHRKTPSGIDWVMTDAGRDTEVRDHLLESFGRSARYGGTMLEQLTGRPGADPLALDIIGLDRPELLQHLRTRLRITNGDDLQP